jgi:hypothetical protein
MPGETPGQGLQAFEETSNVSPSILAVREACTKGENPYHP